MPNIPEHNDLIAEIEMLGERLSRLEKETDVSRYVHRLNQINDCGKY